MGFDSSDRVLSNRFVRVADEGLLEPIRNGDGDLCFGNTLSIVLM